jgi:outer membrane immunogenic protein
MKKFLLGASALVAIGMVTPASAADLAARPYTKAPPMIAAVVYDWSGFYIGANGGGGWSHDSRTNVTLNTFLGSHDATGAVAGGQIGYRWQTGAWVFGLEAQGDWADLRGSSPNLFPGVTNTLQSKLDAFGLFTGQVGYAWNNVLLYAKGGAAVTDRRFEFISPGGVLLASEGYDTRWSPTVGAGLEYGFAPNWSVAVEYDHIFENRRNMNFITPAGVLVGGGAIYNSGGDTDLVTARVNFRWGGPVVARY